MGLSDCPYEAVPQPAPESTLSFMDTAVVPIREGDLNIGEFAEK